MKILFFTLGTFSWWRLKALALREKARAYDSTTFLRVVDLIDFADAMAELAVASGDHRRMQIAVESIVDAASVEIGEALDPDALAG